LFLSSRKNCGSSLNPKQIGLVLGPVFFGLVVILFPPTEEGLSKEGVSVLAVSIWMIIWWITEAIPVYATALLPLALMPVLGVLPLQDIAAEYMHPIIVLLLGMFLIAIAIEKSEFHKRIVWEKKNFHVPIVNLNSKTNTIYLNTSIEYILVRDY
jgi:solute carrier family 13 (sodium-dependent dicarboxylate transporter), member 2/3/5